MAKQLWAVSMDLTQKTGNKCFIQPAKLLCNVYGTCIIYKDGCRLRVNYQTLDDTAECVGTASKRN